MTPYFRFIAAAGFTNLADGIATVAWAWLATLLTRDPLYVALVPVALRLPHLAREEIVSGLASAAAAAATAAAAELDESASKS